ncbi:Uncharacterised protein [Yersinia enterocolitica]|nr:Uncharacterised protein [Yersinia enterocolitica]
MTAAWLGVVYQPLQLLIHLFGNTGFQYTYIKAKGAGGFVGLPPLDHLDEIAQRFNHPSDCANGAFMFMDVLRGLHH